MTSKRFTDDADIALVGEIDVRRELAAEGWLTINTNTEKGNFPNVDLIAARHDSVHRIQVKTTNGEEGSHRHCLYLGRAEGWLKNKTPFFNNKNGILKADIVVLVLALRERSRFVVLPVALAEKIARADVEEWSEVPKRDGNRRSPGFDARPGFTRLSTNAMPKAASIQKTLKAYENNWDMLDETSKRLSDPRAWKLLY